MSKIEAIVPLASSRVSKNWQQTCRMLESTMRTLLALPPDFLSISVVGHERPPGLPESNRCRWTSVDWAPPDPQDTAAKVQDKGLKVQFGVRDAYRREGSWVMVVDADDLVSSRLPEFCDFTNHDAICFVNGYKWEVGSRWLEHVPDFHRVCGTSWIMKLVPEFFPVWLGPGTARICDQSHSKVHEALVSIGAKIQQIRTPLSIYCVNSGANTGHGARPEQAGLKIVERTARALRISARQILRSRRLTPKLLQEFSLYDHKLCRNTSPD